MMTKKQLKARRLRKLIEHKRNCLRNLPKWKRPQAVGGFGRNHTYRLYNI